MADLARQSCGRLIHATADIRIEPPAVKQVGETDMAMEIGRGLVNEALRMLKTACESEGFAVDISIRLVVY